MIQKNNFFYFLLIFFTYCTNILSINLGKKSFDIKKILFKENNCVRHAIFSPKDNVRKYIIELIKNEQKGIRGAIYTFSDKYIMQELIKAKKERNVNVEIILDSSNIESRLEKMLFMQKNNLNLFIFNTPKIQPKKRGYKKAYQPLMHHKFIIFEKNICDKSILATGSFNWTYSANLINCENLAILDDASLLELYNNEFINIKTKSTALESYKSQFQKKIEQDNKNLLDKIRDFKISKL